MDEKEVIPLHKIVQRENGEYFKCAILKNFLQTNTTTTGTTLTNTTVESDKEFNDDDETDVVLSLQPFSPEEHNKFIKKKVLISFNKIFYFLSFIVTINIQQKKKNIVEYFGVGAKSIIENVENKPNVYREESKLDLNKNQQFTTQSKIFLII